VFEQESRMGAQRVPLPFNVVLMPGAGTRSTLTPAEFLALPLSVRITALLDDGLEFLQDGKPVDRKLALAALRVAWVPQ
jgi:hypothetical protein